MNDKFPNHRKSNSIAIGIVTAITVVLIIMAIAYGVTLSYSESGGTPSVPKQTTAKEPTRYSSEMYHVGKTLEAGDYVAFPFDTIGKYKVTEDEYGFNILREEHVSGFWTITLKDGEYVFLDECYLIPLIETPSYKNDDSFDFSQFDGDDVRLKVGYHVPPGEYVFSEQVEVYSTLVDDNGSEAEAIFASYYPSDGYNHSPYSICSLNEGEYCAMWGDFGSAYFKTLEETKDDFDICNFGVYKVGVHLPPGRYTVDAVAEYYSIIDYWSYDGSIKIYEGRELKDELKVEEETEVRLCENQTVVFTQIKILQRNNLDE